MTDTDRLRALRDEIEGILEDRITDLSAHVMAVQEVTRQIAAAEGDLRRQEAVRGALSGELERLTAGAKSLQSDNTELQARVDKLKSNVKRMKKLRAELMTSLSGLSSELKSLSGGNE